MNVRDLINKLSGYDGETQVLLSSDEEGNSFGRLYDVGLYFIEPNADKHGSVEDLYSSMELLDQGEELGEYEPRVVLWP